jgi:hypothetical protein
MKRASLYATACVLLACLASSCARSVHPAGIDAALSDAVMLEAVFVDRGSDADWCPEMDVPLVFDDGGVPFYALIPCREFSACPSPFFCEWTPGCLSCWGRCTGRGGLGVVTQFCGCEGVTFTSLDNISRRPFAHVGSCEDGGPARCASSHATFRPFTLTTRFASGTSRSSRPTIPIVPSNDPIVPRNDSIVPPNDPIVRSNDRDEFPLDFDPSRDLPCLDSPHPIAKSSGRSTDFSGTRKRGPMPKHVFYPPIELADHVTSYIQGLKDHRADYGDVPENAPADLKSLEAEAKKLEPMAKEIEDLQLQLAAKLEAYHRAAAPLWTHFSEKLGHAKVHADKNDKTALLNFLKGFQHHARNHAAARTAHAAPAAAPSAAPSAK